MLSVGSYYMRNKNGESMINYKMVFLAILVLCSTLSPSSSKNIFDDDSHKPEKSIMLKTNQTYLPQYNQVPLYNNPYYY